MLDLPDALPFLAVILGTVAALFAASYTSKAHDAALATKEAERRRRIAQASVELVTPSKAPHFDTLISRE